jgi:predicted nucleotidyltransferase
MVRRFAIKVPDVAVSSFCKRWKISEFALFGSVLDDQFQSESDVDVLVSFLPDAEWDIFDAVRMEEELADIFGRRVDLVTRRSIETSANPIRREAILNSAVPIYVA